MNQCGRRVRLEELFAAHNARAAGDEGQFIKVPHALVIIAAYCII